jgi:hypothetical protein
MCHQRQGWWLGRLARRLWFAGRRMDDADGGATAKGQVLIRETGLLFHVKHGAWPGMREGVWNGPAQRISVLSEATRRVVRQYAAQPTPIAAVEFALRPCVGKTCRVSRYAVGRDSVRRMIVRCLQGRGASEGACGMPDARRTRPPCFRQGGLRVAAIGVPRGTPSSRMLLVQAESRASRDQPRSHSLARGPSPGKMPFASAGQRQADAARLTQITVAGLSAGRRPTAFRTHANRDPAST